jgi:hypothetical protein
MPRNPRPPRRHSLQAVHAAIEDPFPLRLQSIEGRLCRPETVRAKKIRARLSSRGVS